MALSRLAGLKTTLGLVPKALLKVSLASSPAPVLAPATTVIVPLVSLPSMLTTGAAMLFRVSATPAAVPTAVVGALPAVIMCPFIVMLATVMFSTVRLPAITTSPFTVKLARVVGPDTFRLPATATLPPTTMSPLKVALTVMLRPVTCSY